MTYFCLGFIAGCIATTGLSMGMIWYFLSDPTHPNAEKRWTTVKKAMGVKPKGQIFYPPTDLEDAQQAIIQHNREQGKDTPVSELIEDNE